jgi:hypothetical protein
MSDTRHHVHELIDRLRPERAVAGAKQSLLEHGGKGIPNEEVLADFGLTAEEFRRMGEERQTARRLLEGLADQALTGYGDVERLQAVEPPEFRLRLGDYRLRFYDPGDRIQILRLLHRGEAYRCEPHSFGTPRSRDGLTPLDSSR